MNIEEIENKIKELQEEVEKLKKEKNSKKRRVGMGEHYYYIDANNLVTETYEGYTKGDNTKYNIHNYFKTEEEAQAVVDNIKTHIELMELAEELNTEPIDWNDGKQNKYLIALGKKDILQDVTFYAKTANTIYCTNSYFKNEAIKRIGEERLIKYLKGE